MSDSSDANLQLKKRARRRLVGAFAFAGLAAVILPMVMDEEPKQQVQDVQIRIPGQDQTPFVNKLAKPAPDSGEPLVPPEAADPVVPQAAEAVHKPTEVPPLRPVEKAPEKPAEKVPEKVSEKTAAKPAEKPKSADKETHETQRAAAILDGKAGEAAAKPTANGNGQFVILIGAFSNPANVKQLQTKIGELGVKIYTEPLDSPSGKKTRVRAGPFPNREAADKALERLKRIGVNGVVAGK